MDREFREANILKSYSDVLGNEKILSDLTFVVGSNKEKICCHKVFLAARSPVFKVMFTDRWDTDDEIQLPNVEPHIFRMFLEYLYAGKIPKGYELGVSEIGMLIHLADYYDVSSLLKKLKEFLISKYSANNILQIHDVVDRFNLAELKYRTAIVMIREFPELLLEPSFESMDKKLLEMCVIERSDTALKEIDVFNGLMKWSEARCKEAVLEVSGENKRKMLGDLFNCIQFGRILMGDFKYFVVPSNILTDEEIFIISSRKRFSRKKGDVEWTRGMASNKTKPRYKSELLRQYYDESLLGNFELNPKIYAK